MRQWYERLFENYANRYETECFVKGTMGECDFIEQEFKSAGLRRILDIGCGTGRHAIELARRGFSVTGVDLSESMLKKAHEKAAKAGVSVEFKQMDARQLDLPLEFDGIIMMCEGSFPLMETDEMNYRILQNACRCLLPGGIFMFTTLNGLFPLFHNVEAFLAAESVEGNAHYSSNSFDLMTFRDHSKTSITDDDGNTVELDSNERYYVPSEITWLLKSAGFDSIEIFGARLGAFSRDHALRTDDYEMLVIAHKPLSNNI
ncbi:methyltransferase domain-containing protein [bacterium]|nr:methyltransferase domain-containing protein [candidate division CSSED10-310 bacterium]